MATMNDAATAPATASERLNLQSEALLLAITLMDLLVLHLVINLVSGTRVYIALWPLAVIAVGSYLLALTLESRGVGSPAYELALATGAVGGTLLVLWSQFFSDYGLLQPEWIGALLGAILSLSYPIIPVLTVILLLGYIWNRAINANMSKPPDVQARFGLGLLVLIGFGLLRLFGGGTELEAPVNRAIFWFFLAGMLALALRRSLMEGERGHPILSTRWLAVSLGVVGGLLVLGAAVTGLFSRDLSEALLQPVMNGLTLLGAALYIVFAFVVQLLFLLLEPLRDFLLRLMNQPRPQQQSPMQGLLKQLQTLEQGGGPTGGDAGPLLPVLGIAAVLLALFLIWLFWEPSRRRRQRGGAEERESAWDWSFLRAALADLRQGRSHAGPPPDPLTALARDPRYRYTVQIRTIYRQVLDLGAARGVPRPAPETADELLPALEQALPGDATSLRTITTVYDQVRYRTGPATESEAAAATAAWQALAGRDDKRGTGDRGPGTRDQGR